MAHYNKELDASVKQINEGKSISHADVLNRVNNGSNENKNSYFYNTSKANRMTVAQKKNQLAQKVLQTEDKHILKAIELLFNQEDESFELTPAEKRELDARLEDVESGKAKFYTISEAKKMVRKNAKNK